MDPVEYAEAYDKKFRSALGQRFQHIKINASIIKKCLHLNTTSLTQQEEECLEREAHLLSKYYAEAKITP